MTARGKRFPAAIAFALLLLLPLSGCWDNHELDAMFIITGVALDTTGDDDLMEITLQIGETKREASGSGAASSRENSVLLLNTTATTMMGALTEFNRNSSHRLLMHHNQVVLFGSELAGQGVEPRIDLFMRDQQARMEIPVVVVEGRAEEVLAANLAQEKISGIFLARTLDDLARISRYYPVRLLDFASRLLDKTTAPVAPLVRVKSTKDNRQELEITGMAVFRKDKMIGRLTNQETAGYVLTMGDVKQYDLVADAGADKAVFHISKLSGKKRVLLREDGGVRVALDIDATVNVGELRGFAGMTPEQIMPYLAELAQDQIKKQIMDTFETVRDMNADIYGFGTAVHRRYPKEWKDMEDRWDEIFPEIELDVQAKVRTPGIGQIAQSLEMEGESGED